MNCNNVDQDCVFGVDLEYDNQTSNLLIVPRIFKRTLLHGGVKLLCVLVVVASCLINTGVSFSVQWRAILLVSNLRISYHIS
jgi:hypothetical protein